MTSPGPVILLVEDEPAIRRLLRPGLQSSGYRLVEAWTAAEGAAQAAAHHPDAVLLDLGLPDGDGVGSRVDGDELAVFVTCDRSEYCNANYYAEVPLGTAIAIATRNGGVKLTQVDASVTADVIGGGVDGVRLRAPALTLTVEAGDVTLDCIGPHADRVAPCGIELRGQVELTDRRLVLPLREHIERRSVGRDRCGCADHGRRRDR